MLGAGCDTFADRPERGVGPSIDGPSVKLGALVGQLAKPAPGQEGIGFYGADLGWSFQHGDRLHVLFGDSWQNTAGALIGDGRDDGEGWISLRDFPDGDAVERNAAAGSSPAGRSARTTPYRGTAPDLQMRVDAAGKVAPIALYRGDVDGPALPMSILQVPIAGFSNGRDAFALFNRGVPLQCSDETRTGCPGRFRCDEQLGVCAGAQMGPGGTYQSPCVLGTSACDCRPVPGGGLCQDRESSQYRAELDAARAWSVVLEHEVGVAVGPATYVTRPWHTHRFMNAVAKSVRDFDPRRADPRHNDYRPIAEPAGGAKVLLWGRPNFVGIGAAGLDASLYFAYADMPQADATGAFEWAPRYFTGLRAGRPQFSDDPSDAAPLALAGGEQLTREQRDFVNQMGISWIAPLRRWAMFYGGGAPSAVDGSVTLPDGTRPVHDARNAIVARFAQHPWGPWSAATEVLAAGDPMAAMPASSSEFGPGGMLHHAACNGEGCAPGEACPLYEHTPWGFFYAPLIVDAWTEAREARAGGQAADVYWFVSTWAPYQVALMKTRISVGPRRD